MRFDASDSESYFDEVNRRIRSEFDPVWPYRLGLEYAVGSVALRGGYAADPDPRSALDAPDRTRTYYTAGLSYEVGEDVRFELSWQREQFEDRFHPYSNAPVNPVVSEAFTRDTFTGGLRITL
jgi:long-subunit fatty acid transport protein